MADLAIALSGELAFGQVLAEIDLDEGRLVALALGGRVDQSPPAEALEALHEGERALAAGMVARRARTWVGGRMALRRAMAAVAPGAMADRAIVSDDRGAPVLTEAVVGSIAHKDEVAVALASVDRSSQAGVDVESSRPMSLRLERRILVASESAALDALGLEHAARGVELARRFAAKEAIYKCIDPFLRRWVGFHEVALDGAASRYRVTLLLEGSSDRALEVEARVMDAGEVVIAVARARARG